MASQKSSDGLFTNLSPRQRLSEKDSTIAKSPESTEMGRFMRLIRIWGPPALVAGSIFVLSSIPGNDYPSHPEIANVAAHFAEFTLLAFFLARALRQTGVATGTIDTILFAVVICMGYGLLDELHQFAIPNRVFDTMDIMVDTFGALTGSVALVIYLRRTEG